MCLPMCMWNCLVYTHVHQKSFVLADCHGAVLRPHLYSHLWSTCVSLAELLLKTAAEVMFDIALTCQVWRCARACSGGHDLKLTVCLGLPVPGPHIGDNSDRLCNTNVTFLLAFLLYWQLLLLAQLKMNLSSAKVLFPQQCCCQCVF